MGLHFKWKIPVIILISLVITLGGFLAATGIFTDNSVQGEQIRGGINRFEALQVDVPTSKAELGERLFFDKRLSGDASTSCATCHVPELAYADGEALSKGYSRNTLYFRNTPSLINATKMPVYDWDGRFAQGDLSSLIRDHVAEAHFMHLDGRLLIERMRQIPEYEQAFQDLYGGSASYGRTLGAVGEFISTLNSQGNPYVDYMAGDTSALSKQERAGLDLFNGKAGCVQCHSGELLSDGDFHALGVPENTDIFQEPLRHITFRRFFRAFGVGEYVTMRADPGLYALTLEEEDRGKFRTPSILEAAQTAPYMHNGMLPTLQDVVEFYNEGGGNSPNKSPLLRPLGLSSQEQSDLLAFLESLKSDSVPVVQEPELPAYQPRTLGAN